MSGWPLRTVVAVDGTRTVEMLYPTVTADLDSPYGTVDVDTGRSVDSRQAKQAAQAT